MGDWPGVSFLTLSAKSVRNASRHGLVQYRECAENAPEEQVRLDDEMATFRRNARRAVISFSAG